MFLKIILLLLNRLQLDVYLGHWGGEGSAIFDPKCEFEAQNWDTRTSTRVT